jgi:DNA-binding CsgD family transcriptional regulator
MPCAHIIHHSETQLRAGVSGDAQSPTGQVGNHEVERGLGILSKPFSGSDLLTSRERFVLAQLVSGATSKEAARALNISPRTVEFHRANIMKKLGTRNLVEVTNNLL